MGVLGDFFSFVSKNKTMLGETINMSETIIPLLI